MADPDVVSRMREAADILEEVSKLYDVFDPRKWPWTAEELRREADVLEVPF